MYFGTCDDNPYDIPVNTPVRVITPLQAAGIPTPVPYSMEVTQWPITHDTYQLPVVPGLVSFGKEPYILVGASSTRMVTIGAAKYRNFSQLPHLGTGGKAYLMLFNVGYNYSPTPVIAYSSLSRWDEESAWSTQTYRNEGGLVAGAMGASPAARSEAGTWTAVDITASYNHMKEGEQYYGWNGWVVRPTVFNGQMNMFASKDHPDASLRPHILVMARKQTLLEWPLNTPYNNRFVQYGFGGYPGDDYYSSNQCPARASTGVQYKYANGQPVKAAHAGVVRAITRYQGPQGSSYVITLENRPSTSGIGIFGMFGMMSRIISGAQTAYTTSYGRVIPAPGISVGQTVAAGQVIATMNGTNYDTLFFSVRPMPFGGEDVYARMELSQNATCFGQAAWPNGFVNPENMQSFRFR